jgi:hypothetical protein
MIENRSLPPGAVVPFLLYNHAPRAIEWKMWTGTAGTHEITARGF